MEKLIKKLDLYQKAVSSFEKLLEQNLNELNLSDTLIDGLKNGQIQKFEYCTELTWKLIRRFLIEVDGIEAKSPKESIKEYFLKGYIEEAQYEKMFQMINDRNDLSHLYSESEFELILKCLPEYLKLMKSVLITIQEKIKKP